MSKYFDDDEVWRELAAAIVKLAFDDYTNAFVSLATKASKKALEMAYETIAEVESFFRSEYYELLTDIDAGRVMARAQEKAEEIVVKRMTKEIRKELKRGEYVLSGGEEADHDKAVDNDGRSGGSKGIAAGGGSGDNRRERVITCANT